MTVPCNGCTLCCQRDLIPIHAELGDDVSTFEHEYIELQTGERVAIVKRGPTNACFYLDPGKGCSIYERRPAICRGFDCAAAYKTYNKAQRENLLAAGAASKAVFDRGHQLLKNGYRPEALANARRLKGALARRK